MGYLAIKNGIAARLKGLGLAESKEPFDFENASNTEYDKAFIINAISGDASDDFQVTVGRVHDQQLWTIQIAFSRGTFNDLAQKDKLHLKREAIVSDLDDPTNWQSFVRELRYRNFSIEQLEDYFLLSIELEIMDVITY